MGREWCSEGSQIKGDFGKRGRKSDKGLSGDQCCMKQEFEQVLKKDHEKRWKRFFASAVLSSRTQYAVKQTKNDFRSPEKGTEFWSQLL